MSNDNETSNNIKNYLDENVSKAKPRVMKIHDAAAMGADNETSFAEYAQAFAEEAKSFAEEAKSFANRAKDSKK